MLISLSAPFQKGLNRLCQKMTAKNFKQAVTPKLITLSYSLFFAQSQLLSV